MSDVSLFPNPPKPPKPRRRRRPQPEDACCVEWVEFVDERTKRRDTTTAVEATVHRLGHSRTPFSATKLRDLTGCSDFTARTAIGVGEKRTWFVRVQTYNARDPELWVGVL